MTEMLVCILMFVLITMALMVGYTSVNKNKNKIINRLNDSDFVLTTDYKIRSEVWNLQIPFWARIDKEFDQIRQLLFTSISTEKINIKDIKLMEEQSGFYKIKVIWDYKNTEYETIESLTVKQLVK